jgi:parvulin-like peptidyl-prolyl isomerase
VKSTGKRRNIIIFAGAAAVIILIAAFAIYADRVAPFSTTVIEVDDRSVSMRTFLRRAYLSGEEPMAMLQTIANEEIINKVVPSPPYNIVVTDQDVTLFLKDVAKGESGTISDEEFKAWYRQQINESLMPEKDFRYLIRTTLLMRQFSEYLRERVPTVAEQVHLYMIPIAGLPAAREAKLLLDDGSDFASIAEEYSSDELVKVSGGEVGWYARGSLSPQIERHVFDELEIGEISEPLYIDDETFALAKVVEKAEAREIDSKVREILQDRALQTWLQTEKKQHDVQYYGFRGTYSSETDAWIRWQIQKMKR